MCSHWKVQMGKRIMRFALYLTVTTLIVVIAWVLRAKCQFHKVSQEVQPISLPEAPTEDHAYNGSGFSKSKILILTTARSGSSYTGYLFASNPDVFYLFEPLSVYDPSQDPYIKKDVIASSENRGYNCINQSVTCRLDYLYSCQILQYFKEAYFRQPEEPDAITSWYSKIFGELQRKLDIEAINAGLDNLCIQRFNTVAIKTIRVKFIEDVIPLMEQGLKVIYLVRDPRGVANSRIAINFMTEGPRFTKQLKRECGKYDKNIDLLMKSSTNDDLKHLLQTNLVVVRYEDIIQNLYGIARKLYKFVNLDMPREVEEFAKSNAYVGVWTNPNVNKNRASYDEKKNLQRWRRELHFSTVQQIQDICGYSMNTFGYTLIRKESDMRKLNYSVIGKVDGQLPCYMDL